MSGGSRPVSGPDTIGLTVNGTDRSVLEGTTVDDLIRSLDMNPALIVVEHNLEILDRETYGEVVLSPGDRVELVHFVGGG